MANETSGRRDNRVPFRASTKTPNIMMLRRTRLLLIVCGILAFAVLGIKLFSVMIIHHDEYEKMAIDQQVRETEITASRGAIYDTNGKILAMNASVDTIFISPAEIAKNNEDPQLIARELSEILDVDYDKILSMTKNTDRWYEVVKRKVEPDVSEKVRAFKKEKKLVGVKIEPDTKRYYPYGSLAAHVIGFVGQDNEGRYGLEQRYDSYLTGSTGRIIRATDNRGTDMLFVNYEDYYDETKGNDMNLTIDATIQYYVEKHLQQAVEDYDVQNGAAAIAMDPSTGAILGMVSLGNFDLNNYQKISDKDQEAIDAETDPDKRSELLTAAQQKQWRNKALSDTYEPGSTFKIITLAMALEEGVVSESSSFYCGGSIPVLGRTDPVKCWKTAGHGSQTLTQAMQHSCNVALVQIGQLVGARTFYKYAEAFGFLNLTNNVDSSLTAKTGIAGYRIGGKTGTSEKVAQDAAGGAKEYIVSFIGFAPADDPQIVILVLLDTPSSSTGIYISGGQMAAPTVGKMMADILPYLGVEPSYSETEKTYMDKTVPNVTGLSVEQAKAALEEVGLQARVYGEGGTVTAQLPGSGAVVASGSTILLYAGKEPSPDKETMPDLTNLSYQTARDRMAALGLYIKTNSSITDTAQIVSGQTVAAGTQLDHGTVVEVTLVTSDSSMLGRY